jgi:hypothetical protein
VAPRSESAEFDAAILSLVSRSAEALRAALFWIETSRRLGDMPVAEAQQGLVVQMLADGGFYLDIGEDLARDLVARSSTKTNLELLASVLKANNQTVEALQIEKLADQTEPTEEEVATRRAVARLHRHDTE